MLKKTKLFDELASIKNNSNKLVLIRNNSNNEVNKFSINGDIEFVKKSRKSKGQNLSKP